MSAARVNDVIGLIELAMAAGVAMVLLWFVWSVFLRRYWRVLRMRHARDRREMEEAARRR
ncbi:MAG: hypothetical protein M3P27_00140 [Acidobacteriota bacterium]|nr:hypothetical protein [Acidobacteriota bacterium]